MIRVPYMDEDVHDLGGLLKINRYLFATEQEREEMAAPERHSPSRGSEVCLVGALALVAKLADVPVGRVRHREQVADAVGGLFVELALLAAVAARAGEGGPVDLPAAVGCAEPVGLGFSPGGPGMILWRP